MHWLREILIFLLFLALSSLVWLIHARDKQMQQSAAVQSEPQEQEAAMQDPVTEKKLQLPVEVMDVPEDRTMRVFPSSVSVFVRVHVSDFEAANADDLRVWCSYPTRPSDVLTLHTDVTNERILGVRTIPEKVEYIIEYPSGEN